MRRPVRTFQAEPIALEGRRLLASHPAGTAISAAAPPPVRFDVAYDPQAYLGDFPMQLVSQQASSATVTLSRPSTDGVLQVRVTTSGLSPAVGVNVDAVDQTVTFADGQSQATLAVPIIPGAPNPGVVDVELGVEPVAPQARYPIFQRGSTLDLKVVGSDPAAPPTVTSAFYAGPGLLLTFNKPMDSAAADDVANYAVDRTSFQQHTILFVVGTRTTSSRSRVPLRAARYDAATQSVLLVPRNPHFAVNSSSSVTQVHWARISAGPGHSSPATPGIVDLQGTPVNAATNPGKVAIHIQDLNTTGGYGL